MKSKGYNSIDSKGEYDPSSTRVLRKRVLKALQDRKGKWVSYEWIFNRLSIQVFTRRGDVLKSMNAKLAKERSLGSTIRDLRRPQFGAYSVDSKKDDGVLYYRINGKQSHYSIDGRQIKLKFSKHK